MQTTDIIILIGLAVPGIVGVVYGFLNLLFSIIAWLLSVAISIKFTPFFSPMLEASVSTPVLRNVIAFVGLFIASLMILTLIGYLIVKLLGRAGLTPIDRILGFFFGIGLGGAIIGAIVFLAGFTALPREPWWQSSMLLRPFERMAIWTEQFLPENILKYHSYSITPAESNPGERN